MVLVLPRTSIRRCAKAAPEETEFPPITNDERILAVKHCLIFGRSLLILLGRRSLSKINSLVVTTSFTGY